MELEIYLENVEYQIDVVSGDWSLIVMENGRHIAVCSDYVDVKSMIEHQLEENNRYFEISNIDTDSDTGRDHGWFVGQMLPIGATIK